MSDQKVYVYKIVVDNGGAIGMDLEVESQEQSVGQFRADILCRDTANQSWVLIENQLEKTDHGHLGQLITYAAGLEVELWRIGDSLMAQRTNVHLRMQQQHRARLRGQEPLRFQ